MSFEVHGDYRVGMDGVIILFQAFGSWNKEGSASCTNLINNLVDSLKGAKFGILIDSIDFTGVTADGYSDWYDAIHYWDKHNLAAVVRVDNVEAVHYEAFLKSFDIMFNELTDFKNSKSYKEALSFLWSHG